MFDLVNDDEMVVRGNRERVIQRISWQGGVVLQLFRRNNKHVVNGDAIAAGDLASTDMRIVQALGGLNISNNRIIFTHDGFVDELLTNGFVQETPRGKFNTVDNSFQTGRAKRQSSRFYLTIH